VRLLCVQIAELEQSVKPMNQNVRWKAERTSWQQALQSTSSVSQATELLLWMTKGLSVYDWKKEAKEKWRRGAASSTTSVDLAQAILLLIKTLPEKAFLDSWQQEKRPNVEHVCEHLSTLGAEQRRKLRASVLATRCLAEPTLCEHVLRACADDEQAVLAYIKENQERIARERIRAACSANGTAWLAEPLLSSGAEPSLVVESAPSLDPLQCSQLIGLWETSVGVGVLHGEEVYGKEVHGELGGGRGVVRGFALRRPLGTWELLGRVRDGSRCGWRAFELCFDEAVKRVSGTMHEAQASGQWSGSKMQRHDRRAEVGYAGLENTGNSCYQNSFLQCLYMTRRFTDSLLRRRLCSLDELDQEAGEADAVLVAEANVICDHPASAVVPAAAAHRAMALQPAREEERVLVANPLLVRLQELFADLALSQRPFLRPNIKSALCEPFNGGRQQDSFLFGTILLDSMVECLRGGEAEGVVRDTFGGVIKNLVRCGDCGHVSARAEPFTNLCVPFPNNYRPITELAVVTGPTPGQRPPPGFDRVNTDLNSGRRDLAPCSYLCVRRDPDAAPITGIQLLLHAVVKSSADAAKTTSRANNHQNDAAASKEEREKEPPHMPVAPHGYELLSENLNPGADLAVYLAFTRDPHGSPINALAVATASSDAAQVSVPDGYRRLDVNLNEGTPGDSQVYLCVKRSDPIREVRLLVCEGDSTEERTRELARLSAELPPSFTVLPTDLCLGGDAAGVGVSRYLAISSAGVGAPITALSVVSAAAEVTARRPADRSQTTDAVRLRTVTHSAGESGSASKESGPLSQESGPLSQESELSSTQSHSSSQENGSCSAGAFAVLDSPYLSSSSSSSASSSLPLHTLLPLGDGSYLRCARGDGCPVHYVDVFRAPNHPPRYGYELVPLYVGRSRNQPARRHACEGVWILKSGEELHLRVVRSNLTCYAIEGKYTTRGGVTFGLLHDAAGEECHDEEQLEAASSPCWKLSGHWTQTNYKEPQPATFTFDADFSSFEGAWMAGDKRGSWNGIRDPTASASKKATAELESLQRVQGDDGQRAQAIADVQLVWAGVEPIPDGYEVVSDLERPLRANAQDAVAVDAEQPCSGLHMCVRRLPLDDDSASTLSELGVVWAEIENVPKGFEAVERTRGGRDAALRAGHGSGHRLLLVLKRAKGARVALSQVQVAYARSELPRECERISHTPMVLDASLNEAAKHEVRGRNMDVWLGISTLPRFAHAIAGEWETSSGRWTASVGARVPGVLLVEGRYGRQLENRVRGLLVPEGGHGYELMAVYEERERKHPGYLSLSLDRDCTRLEGSGSYGNERVSAWEGSRDDFVTLGLKKDYTSLWQAGRELFSDSAAGNSIDALLSQSLQPEVLGGSNQLRCHACEQLSDALRYTCVFRAPEHLVVCVKRFAYDYKSGELNKLLDAVRFSPTVTLPGTPAALRAQVFDEAGDAEREEASGAPLHYGLYAVVVHLGRTIDGGHYYTFARDSSDAAQLHLHDDPENAPWACYNDESVTPTTWAEFTERLDSSLDNSAYILFYRRLRTGAVAALVSDTSAEQEKSAAAVSVLPKQVAASLVARCAKDSRHFLFSELGQYGGGPHHLEQLRRRAAMIALTQ